MKKIAIDGRSLTAHPSGVANFLISGINHMAMNGFCLIILTHKPLHEEVTKRLNKSKNIIHIHSPFFLFKNVGLLWFMFKIKELVYKTKAEYFWGPGQVIPRNLDVKIRTIVTIHDLVFKLYPNTMSLKTRLEHLIWIKHSIKNSDLIWCVSKYTKNELERYYPNRKCKDIFVGSSVEDSVFRPLKISENDKNIILNKFKITQAFILFVGTLEPRKNLKFLLKLMPEIEKRELELVIVGVKGWGKTDVESIINKEGFSKNKIILTGFITTEELVNLYNLAKVLILPSLNEGFGLPLLEALKCGCPVIAAKNSGMIEVVENHGWLVDGWNSSDWIHALDQVIIHRKPTTIVSDNLQSFNWSQIISSLGEKL